MNPSVRQAEINPYNPYRPPAAGLVPKTAGTATDAETIRRELLQHETSVRSIGLLYYFGFSMLTLATIGTLGAIVFGDLGELDSISVGLTALYALVAALAFYLARGLRRLDPKIRGPVTAFAALGLLGFPFGTLINAYILYLLHSDKGKRVMSEEYRDIIARTPHIKYKSPTWLIVAGLLILALVVIAIVVSMSS